MILDARGRPLARNRTALVVSISRTACCASTTAAGRWSPKVAKVIGQPFAGRLGPDPALRHATARRRRPVLQRLALPADPGDRRGQHRDGAADHGAARGLPRRDRRAHVGARVPAAARRQRRPRARLPRPGHRRRADGARGRERRTVARRTRPSCRAPTWSAGPASSGSTTTTCAARPGVKTLAVDHQGGVSGALSETQPTAGNYLVTTIDATVQAAAEKQLKAAIKRARHDR